MQTVTAQQVIMEIPNNFTLSLILTIIPSPPDLVSRLFIRVFGNADDFAAVHLNDSVGGFGYIAVVRYHNHRKALFLVQPDDIVVPSDSLRALLLSLHAVVRRR